MSKKIIIICLTVLTGALFLSSFSLAQPDPEPYQPPSKFVCPDGMSHADCQKLLLEQISNKSYGGDVGIVQSGTIAEKVGRIISMALGFLGVIFLALIVYSGFQWMTAGGNEEKVKAARTRMVNAVIGLIIVLAAYAITYFVTTKLKSAVNLSNTDQACANAGGTCQYDAVTGGVCTISTPDDGIYQSGLCLSDPSPNYLCCVPNEQP